MDLSHGDDIIYIRIIHDVGCQIIYAQYYFRYIILLGSFYLNVLTKYKAICSAAVGSSGSALIYLRINKIMK